MMGFDGTEVVGEPAWQALVNAGAAGLVLFTVVLFMRFMREERQERKAERDAEREQFTQALKDQRGDFTAALKDHGERTEKALEGLTNEIRLGRGNPAA